MTNSKQPHLKTEPMAALYEKGMSCKQIGEKFGINKTSVALRLKKFGVKMRTSSNYDGERRYWMWKGTDYINPLTRKRNSWKHRVWSDKVKLRDQNTCQDCGKKNLMLHAHHLVKLDECLNSQLEFDISNGITLCAKCHGSRHKLLNKRPLT